MTRIIGRAILRRDRVGSTMDEVAVLAAAGEAEGVVVAAEEQTAGRGRAGRRWSAERGTAILCSVLLRPAVAPDRLGVLPLVVGVAVAEAIEEVAPVRCRLKWPNDVWIGEEKVAGVLLAARLGPAGVDHAVVGIGVNVLGTATDWPAGATSVSEAAGFPVEREALFRALLERLDDRYRAYVAAGGAPDLAAWRARAALVGQAVTIEVGDRRREGVFAGIADDGALLLEGPGRGIEAIHAGELVRGPVAAVVGPLDSGSERPNRGPG